MNQIIEQQIAIQILEEIRDQNERTLVVLNTIASLLTPKVKSEKRFNKVFVPPTMEEVVIYCKERKNRVNPQTFVDFYKTRNWTVGKVKMSDWRACVRTWERNDRTEYRGVMNKRVQQKNVTEVMNDQSKEI